MRQLFQALFTCRLQSTALLRSRP